ncbi:MAG: hypothetical protein AAFY71_21465 [Bacteroidota bacterium]
MDLYRIIYLLSDKEYQEFYLSLKNSGSDRSRSFLEIIRSNPKNPQKEYIEKYGVADGTFYVLKARLKKKTEDFLLSRLGDDKLHVAHKVFHLDELIFNQRREKAQAALNSLEQELKKIDYPHGLTKVYMEMKNLNAFAKDYNKYQALYRQQIAYSLAIDKAQDQMVSFFKAYDNFYLSRTQEDLKEMCRIMEALDNHCHLYDSHRLYVLKCIVHIFARLFVPIPDSLRCEVEEIDLMLQKCVAILSEHENDLFYSNLNLLFNFLHLTYYEKMGAWDRARLFREILDYKIPELITLYQVHVNTSLFLFSKLSYHKRNGTIDQLLCDVELMNEDIDLQDYRVSFYVNYHMFRAQAYFEAGEYKRASDILFKLRNEIAFKKYPHMKLEVEFFHLLLYVLLGMDGLANQLHLALQRKLRDEEFECYRKNGKPLLRAFHTKLGGNPEKKNSRISNYLNQFRDNNTDCFALMEGISLEEVLLPKNM